MAKASTDTERERAAAPSPWARWLPIVATTFGLALTMLSVAWEREHALRADRSAFAALTERLRGEIARRVGVYRYGLMGSRSAIIAREGLARAEFRKLVSSRQLRREFPGALGIGYIERVPRDELDAFVARARADEAPDFAVKTSGDRPDLLVIKYIEPYAENLAARGFDVGQEQRRRAAAERAMETGEACVTEAITLVQAAYSGPGFLYLLPVYRHGLTPTTPEARRDALAGWVYMPLIARDIFAGAAATVDGDLDFEIYGSSQVDVDHLIYDDDNHLAGLKAPVTDASFANRRMHVSVPIELGEQRWTATMSTTPKFRSARGFAWELGIGGAALSCLLGLLLNALGVAERRSRALASAMTSELRKLAIIVQRSTNVVLTTDTDQRITWVNEGFTRLTGYSLEEVIGKRPAQLLQFEKTDPKTKAEIREKLSRGESFRGEILNRSKSGREYWLDVTIQPVYEEGGDAIVGFMAIETDITDRKRVEEEVARGAALLAATNAALEEAQAIGKLANWSIDAETRQTVWSKQLYRLLGRDDFDALPDYEESLAAFIDEDAARLDEAVRRALADGTEFGLTVRTRGEGDNARYLRCDGRVRREGGRTTGLYGTLVDVTTELEREEALRVARERAEDASRSKSEFLANMSHEIRTPMAAILGYTDLLAEEVRGLTTSARPREYAATIKRNGEHLLSIINDILDISKIEAGKMTVERVAVRVDVLIGDVLSTMASNAAAKNVALSAFLDTPVPRIIQSDTVRLRQILLNLVGNAIKFTERGVVTLRVSHDPRSGMLSFAVHDSGIGISAAQGALLFAPFSQADSSTTRRFGGSGLGLRISKRLAQALGGDLSFTSELGRGSVFVATVEGGPSESSMFLAPGVTSGAVRASTPAPATSDERALAGLRILLVEDGPDNQRLISFHLRRAGAEVRIADNGRVALEALTVGGDIAGPLDTSTHVDVVLSDIQMPEMDGYSVAASLRRKGYTGVLIALTAHAMESDRKRCLEQGFDDHLAKPIDRALLVQTIVRNIVTRREGAVPSETASDELSVTLSDLRDDPEMTDLVAYFVRCLPERCAEVERAFVARDYVALRMLAHGLKGSGGGFGFWTITAAAEQLEEHAADPRDLAALEASLAHFLAVCRSARHVPPQRSASAS